MEQKLLNLVEQAESILVTSHISPDPDAISSVLLVSRTLAHNFTDKKINAVLEEKPARPLDFLNGYDTLKYQELDKALEELNPELLIIVDANSFARISRKNADKAKKYIEEHKNSIKTAIIDHHEKDGADSADIFINNKRPATAEEAYNLLYESWNLEKPSGYAETALLGIISDTDRHRFDHPGYRETFRIVSDLLDAGASIEKLDSKMDRHSRDELTALCHYMDNITDSGRGYTYSYVSDDFYKMWLAEGKDAGKMKDASEEFANRYLRSFEDNQWGFMVSPEPLSGPGWWGVSLRAVSGTADVSAIARALGGGGHKPAAGAKIQAASIEAAIQKVKDVIDGAVDED